MLWNPFFFANRFKYNMKAIHNLQFKHTLVLFCFFIFTQHCYSQDNPWYNQVSANSFCNTHTFNDSLLFRIDRWKALDLDHKFFIEDSATFHSNQLLILAPITRKYTQQVMSLKWYPPSDSINFKPSLIDKQLLYEEDGYLKVLMENDSFSNKIGPGFDINKKNEELLINNPHLAKFVWKTIPEPHRLITDRTHLDKKTAKEGIQKIRFEEIKYPNQLTERKQATGPWTISGTDNVQFSQAYLENWTQGGENTISLSSDLLLKANYKKDKIEWENYIRYKIGVISSESYATQINTDKIELNTKYGIQASKKWYYSTQFNFNSQFFNGYNTTDQDSITSSFMAPAYLTLAFGMDYKKSNNFTIMLSPLTAKLTYVMDTAKVDQTGYDIDEDKKTAYNNGASIENNIKWEISTELSLQSDLDLFYGYLSSDHMTQIDWELIFNMRVNRFLSTKINTQLRYYTNESDNVQFKEAFTVSFNYKF